MIFLEKVSLFDLEKENRARLARYDSLLDIAGQLGIASPQAQAIAVRRDELLIALGEKKAGE